MIDLSSVSNSILAVSALVAVVGLACRNIDALILVFRKLRAALGLASDEEVYELDFQRRLSAGALTEDELYEIERDEHRARELEDPIGFGPTDFQETDLQPAGGLDGGR